MVRSGDFSPIDYRKFPAVKLNLDGHKLKLFALWQLPWHDNMCKYTYGEYRRSYNDVSTESVVVGTMREMVV